MLSSLRIWAALGLLILGARGSPGDAHRPLSSHPKGPAVYDTTTVLVTHHVDVTVSSTKTLIVSTCITESTTTTLHYTESTTTTLHYTESTTTTLHYTESTTATLHYTVSTTETRSETITDTQTTTATVPETITDTQTTTATVPATITTYTTQTIISTTVDPCPTECSISAGTVTVFFWPTDRPYTYPSTYFATALAYTFTSPSVYMLIDTARGTNSLGPTGPSTSNWILPLDLSEVSTIVDGTATRQLTLSDLGTDCPQTAEPSAIATMVDSRCNPILAAPKQVSSWAYPCNACGRFGLFDPPYAVPTLTGGLVVTTTTAPVETTAAPVPTSTSGPATTAGSLPTSPPSVVTASATRVTGGLVWLILGNIIMAFLS